MSLLSPVRVMDRLQDSWRFLSKKLVTREIGNSAHPGHFLSRLPHMFTSAWMYLDGLHTRTHTHTLYILRLHLCSWQHDKFPACLICLPKQETIHRQHFNVRTHIRDQRIRWDGKLPLLWEYICTCSDLKEQNTCVPSGMWLLLIWNKHPSTAVYHVPVCFAKHHLFYCLAATKERQQWHHFHTHLED